MSFETFFTFRMICNGLSLFHYSRHNLLKKNANSPMIKSVLIEGAGAVELAERVGRSVASQIGKGYEEAEYLGEEGSCPYCHLDLVVLEGKGGNGCECGVCGAKGKLEVDGEGRIKALFEEGSDTSVVTWKGKKNHMVAIEEAGKMLRPKMGTVEEKKEEFAKMEFRKVEFPSQCVEKK